MGDVTGIIIEVTGGITPPAEPAEAGPDATAVTDRAESTNGSAPPGKRLAMRIQREGQRLCLCYGPQGGKSYWLEPSGDLIDTKAADAAIEAGYVKDTGKSLVFGAKGQEFEPSPDL